MKTFVTNAEAPELLTTGEQHQTLVVKTAHIDGMTAGDMLVTNTGVYRVIGQGSFQNLDAEVVKLDITPVAVEEIYGAYRKD
jgi:S-adenosylhomocysteine hydrolase